MSYPIKPDDRYLLSKPKTEGTKRIKIELFQIAQFRQRWNLDNRDEFSPAVPFRHGDRDIYWSFDLYRVRVNGSWFMDNGQYTFLNKQEIFNRWLK